MDILPKDITIDSDNNSQMASFGYYDGIKIAKERKLKQTTSFKEVNNGTHFIVCCGDVMIRTTEKDYPDVKRRII